MNGNDTKLSKSVTVARYQTLALAGNRKEIARFIQERFEERYFRPVEDSCSKHGFTIMAICCLVIEALESFYQGRADTRHASKQMFRDFFGRVTPLKLFGYDGDWFYQDIRCGILHQAEARGGWRVRRRGSLLDTNTRTINATRFLQELRKAVAAYAQQVEKDDACWKKFQEKMKAVCANCSRSKRVIKR